MKKLLTIKINRDNYKKCNGKFKKIGDEKL